MGDLKLAVVKNGTRVHWVDGDHTVCGFTVTDNWKILGDESEYTSKDGALMTDAEPCELCSEALARMDRD